MTNVGLCGASLEFSLSFKCKTPGKVASQHRQALEASNQQRRTPIYPASSSVKSHPGAYFPCKWSVDNANVMRSSCDLCQDPREFHQWQSHSCTLSSWRGNHCNGPRASPVFRLCCAISHQELKAQGYFQKAAGRGRSW